MFLQNNSIYLGSLRLGDRVTVAGEVEGQTAGHAGHDVPVTAVGGARKSQYRRPDPAQRALHDVALGLAGDLVDEAVAQRIVGFPRQRAGYYVVHVVFFPISMTLICCKLSFIVSTHSGNDLTDVQTKDCLRQDVLNSISLEPLHPTDKA